LTESEEEVPRYCQESLQSLRVIVPKVERNYPPRETSATELHHLCDFYQDVLSGGFCPHAPHLFLLGKGATESKLRESDSERQKKPGMG
jgi:hypothetical protein